MQKQHFSNVNLFAILFEPPKAARGIIMKISVLVPTLGAREKELERLLYSLHQQLYKNFEVILVVQGNYLSVEKIVSSFCSLAIRKVYLQEKGLSKARNVGLKEVTGDIVVLSDDDCWYPKDAFGKIADIFQKEPSVKVVLTQIYDKERNVLYKSYLHKKCYISNKLQLMSKSSIEIAYRKNGIRSSGFDERLGLGAEFVCGEEVDFLIRNFCEKEYLYIPAITVYHAKKNCKSSHQQVVAKGALYKKNFNFVVSFGVLARDLIVKRENNIKDFFKGYYEYSKRKS